MKIKRTNMFLMFVFILVFMTMCCFNATEVKAMNTGFSTDELTEEEKNTFISNIALSLVESEPDKSSIVCFDVNENEMIAVGQKSSDRKTICVYSNVGTFQYGYSFNCTGSFGVEWDEEKLNVYFVRSDVIISLDSDGNILDVKEVQNTIDNNTHRNSLLNSTDHIVDDTTYLIRNDMGIFNWIAMSYSQIISIDSMGKECIIYDVNSTQLFNTVVVFVGVFIFTSVVVAGIILEFVKLRRGKAK